jgi:antitoxin HigA-1
MPIHNPPHPGLVLREYLGNLGVSGAAAHLRVTRVALSRVLNAKAGILAGVAIRLAAALGTTPEFWMNPCNRSTTCGGRGKHDNRRCGGSRTSPRGESGRYNGTDLRGGKAHISQRTRDMGRPGFVRLAPQVEMDADAPSFQPFQLGAKNNSSRAMRRTCQNSRGWSLTFNRHLPSSVKVRVTSKS